MTTPTEVVSPAALADIALGVAASPLWHDHAHHDPRERRPARLIATDHYEVWVIGWWPGQSVQPHDHGGSVGVLTVVEGELTELEGPTGTTIRRLPAGSVQEVPADTVHDVLNASDAPATSIHVYSPPLRTMTFYDPWDGHAVDVMDVVEETPVLGAGPAARALHPAGTA
ncbi:MAG: cysteine dioxygenase [Microthrixaceae bacterium]